jgi:uncharacterized protein (TIGR03083 family)
VTDVWQMMAEERTEFADFLDLLTPAQWDAQSLCTEWKVRDAAAHVIGGIELPGIGSFLVSIAKNGFSFNKANSVAARELGSHPTDELVKQLRDHIGVRKTPPGLKPPNLLGDAIVHQQDCRRPLGMPRQIPEERLRTVLDAMKGVNPVVGNKKRIAGVKLVATDMDWMHGEGPEARGPGEALLMAMNGRKAAIDDLEGEGVATLRSR